MVCIGCNEPDPITCGDKMVIINDQCECVPNAHPTEDSESCACDSLYHWDDIEETCVLDTISNDFTWVLDTLGDYGTELNDVEVVSANNIWVVGEIAVPDSSNWIGPGNCNYNLARWNGSSWQFIQIIAPVALNSIHYFDDDDLWVTTNSFPIHWDGSTWTLFHTQEMGIPGSPGLACWGTSSSNMYFVGREGAIVHYDGTSFTKIAQDYDTDFQDVVGTPDGEHVFVLGNSLWSPGEEMLIHLETGTQIWGEIPYPVVGTEEIKIDARNMDVSGNKLYLPMIGGVWTYNYSGLESEFYNPPYSEYGSGVYRMTCAISPNNILFGGSKMNLLHFNGVSYKYVDEIQYNLSHLVMKGGDYNGEVFAMVGYLDDWQHGVVARGYRN